jgi:hypothetical protein
MEYGDLGTIAGISAAATVIVALIKGGISISGRATHVLTVAVSLGLAGAAATQGLLQGNWLQVLLTGVYAAAAAVGLHQAGPGVADNRSN